MATIAEIAVADGNFKTLVTALEVANLVDTLQGEGPFTVFAPVDSAFEKLPAGTVQTLVQNIPQLQRILTYHVVSGRLRQADLADGMMLTSVEGAPIPIHQDESFEVKNASVVAADIEADNGIIHCIDTVLLMG